MMQEGEFKSNKDDCKGHWKSNAEVSKDIVIELLLIWHYMTMLYFKRKYVVQSICKLNPLES